VKVILISNDLTLKQALEDTTSFDEVSIISSMDEVKKDFDVLIISDHKLSVNDIAVFYNQYSSVLNGKSVFYMLSNKYDGSIIDNVSSICASKNIIVIPPKLTCNQIKDRIINKIFPGSAAGNRNIILFLGADHKVGTTMTSDVIAELLSENTNSKVLLMHLNSSPSIYYRKINDQYAYGLDNLKHKLLNRLLTADEIRDASIKVSEKLYVLPGINNITDIKTYLPIDIEYLCDLASEIFNAIIIDAGSCTRMDYHGGLTIAALNMAYKKYLVTTQQEISYIEYDRIENQLLNRLGVYSKDFFVVINKYVNETSIYTPSQVADRYGMLLAGVLPYLDLTGWQAEFDGRNLLNYKNAAYNRSAEELAILIAGQLGLNYANAVKKHGAGISNRIKSLFGGKA